MSQIESSTDLFARVENGQVTEFPVYRLHIKNRAHPLSWYTPVQEGPLPEVPPFHYLTKEVKVVGTEVHLTYGVQAYTLAQLLSQLRVRSDEPGVQDTVLVVTEIDPDLISHVYNMVSDYAHEKLDQFAQTRGYKNLDSLIGKYKNSGIPKLAAEAERGQQLLDLTWGSLLGYFEKVMTGQTPVPSSMEEIDNLLPELTWGDA